MQQGVGFSEGMQIAQSFRMSLYICYVNRSTPMENTGAGSHFVLAGIAIPAVQWKELDSKISGIKRRFVPDEADEERREFLKKICDEITTWPDARLFAEAYDKNALTTSPENPHRLYEDAFTQVVGRFQAFLVNRGNYLESPLYGLVVHSDLGDVALKSANFLRNHPRNGIPWTKFNKIVETLFVDICSTSMMQIAAICGFAVQRFFDNGETDLFDRIYRKFDRAKNTVVGIRHYPSQKCCYCRVCVDRHLPYEKMGAGAPMAARYDGGTRNGPEKDPCRG